MEEHAQAEGESPLFLYVSFNAAHTPLQASVGTGRARLLGFRVGFAGQNPSLGTLRLSGFGPFQALGFSGLFQAFLVPVKHEVSYLFHHVFLCFFYVISFI